MDNLGEVLKKVLEEKGIWTAVKQQEVIEMWDKIVGERIAAHTEAMKVEKGILWVKVKDSAWIHHLSMLKSQLIKKINQSSQKKVVNDIYFFWGELSKDKKGNNAPTEVESNENINYKPAWEYSQKEVENLVNALPESNPKLKEKIAKILSKDY